MNTLTVTIQIGNSDNKLTQEEWALFVATVQDVVTSKVKYAGATVHFFGTSAGHERWQNAAWVVEVAEEGEPSLKKSVAVAGKLFLQDSVAWTVGRTEFV